MRKLAALAPLFLAMSACTNPHGVWLFYFGTPEVTVGDQTCTENFVNANCITTTDPGSTDGWTSQQEGEVSDAAMFGEIIDGPGGESFLVLGGEIFVGAKTNGTYLFVWDGFDTTSSTDSHESGYFFTERNDSTEVTTVALDAGGRTLVGNVSVVTSVDNSWEEADVWNQAGDGVSYGQIGSDTYWYVEGDTNNYVADPECEADPCRVSIRQETTIITPITAVLTGSDDDAYDGLSNASQQQGVPF